MGLIDDAVAIEPNNSTLLDADTETQLVNLLIGTGSLFGLRFSPSSPSNRAKTQLACTHTRGGVEED